jgi:putative two-component system response regulator
MVAVETTVLEGVSRSTRSWLLKLQNHSAEAYEHSLRVTGYSQVIGKLHGLRPRDLHLLKTAALLHDVGKIETPLSILHKPDRLSPEERSIMQEHAEQGYRLLAQDKRAWPRAVLLVARHHHERWDGQGYPHRLAGRAIPFLARILAVADVFDALSAARQYKPVLPPDQCLQIMQQDIGHFDAHIFAKFVRSWDQILSTLQSFQG